MLDSRVAEVFRNASAKLKVSTCTGSQTVTLDILMRVDYHHDVRTTLTIDDDVYRKLQAESKKSGRPFKEVLNDQLRRSFAITPPAQRRTKFHVKAREMGLQPGVDLTNIEAVLDQLDGATRR